MQQQVDRSEFKKERGDAFSAYVLVRLKDDNAFRAVLSRADNPATEYQAWEYLVHWCDIEKPWERLPFAVIGSALAKAKPAKDGNLGIGRSIAACYEDGVKSGPAQAKLRRLLSCNSAEEACRILRPILSLIQSKGKPISYSRLLNELLKFSERQKLRWATDFYGRKDDHDRLDA